MNIGKILDIIAQNNINPEQVFTLVEKIKSADLEDEATLRDIIQEAAAVAGKEVDQLKEDSIVKKIKNEGINESLFDDL